MCKDPAGAEHWLARSIEGLSSAREQTDAKIRLSDLYLARHASQGDYTVAVGAMANQVLERDPRNAEGHRIWGQLALIKASGLESAGQQSKAQDWYLRAIQEFRTALQFGSDRKDAWEGLASALEQTGDLRAAESEWLLFLVKYPSDRNAVFHLLSVQTARGESVAADQTVEGALKAHPANFTFLNDLAAKAWALKQASLFAKVTDWLERAAKDQPTEYLHLARLFESAGNTEKAITEYERCQATVKSDTLCGENRIRLLIATHRMDAAARELSTLQASHPGNQHLSELKAAVLVETGRAEEAIPGLVKLQAADPSNADLMITLARAYQQVGNDSLALGELQVCQRLFPDSVRVLTETARYYLAIREYETAEVMAQRVIDKDATDAEALRIRSEARVNIEDSSVAKVAR